MVVKKKNGVNNAGKMANLNFFIVEGFFGAMAILNVLNYGKSGKILVFRKMATI